MTPRGAPLFFCQNAGLTRRQARDDGPLCGPRTRPFLFQRGRRGAACGRGRGNAPLCGAGNEPPFSFRLRRKENGRSRSKEKALWCPNPALWAGLDKYGGRASRCDRNLRACTGCAWALRNRESASPHLRAGVRLSGWLPNLARFWPRAFRFATRYREVNGAAAEVGAGQIGFVARRTEAVRRGLHACKFQ